MATSHFQFFVYNMASFAPAAAHTLASAARANDLPALRALLRGASSPHDGDAGAAGAAAATTAAASSGGGGDTMDLEDPALPAPPPPRPAAARRGPAYLLRPKWPGAPTAKPVRSGPPRRAPPRHTPLTWAATEGHAEAVRLLLAAGADPNARNAKRLTPLMSAARWNAAPDVTAALLTAGANPLASDARGRTVLMYAAQGGCPEIVAMLLHGVPDDNDRGQDRAAAAAAAGGANPAETKTERRDETAAGMKHARATTTTAAETVHATDADGKTAFAYALAADAFAARDLISAAAAATPAAAAALTGIASRLARGPAPTPEERLLRAANVGDAEAAQRAVEQWGADPNAARGEDGWTALMTAVRLGHVEVVRVLVQAGADVNERTPVAAPVPAARSSNSISHPAEEVGTRGQQHGAVGSDPATPSPRPPVERSYTMLAVAAQRGHTNVVLALLDAPNIDLEVDQVEVALAAHMKQVMDAAADVGNTTEEDGDDGVWGDGGDDDGGDGDGGGGGGGGDGGGGGVVAGDPAVVGVAGGAGQGDAESQAVGAAGIRMLKAKARAAAERRQKEAAEAAARRAAATAKSTAAAAVPIRKKKKKTTKKKKQDTAARRASSHQAATQRTAAIRSAVKRAARARAAKLAANKQLRQNGRRDRPALPRLDR